MNTRDIKSGDVVRLKSGGPKMTVTSALQNPTGTAGQTGLRLTVMWFCGSDGPFDTAFDSSAVTLLDDGGNSQK